MAYHQVIKPGTRTLHISANTGTAIPAPAANKRICIDHCVLGHIGASANGFLRLQSGSKVLAGLPTSTAIPNTVPFDGPLIANAGTAVTIANSGTPSFVEITIVYRLISADAG